MSPAKPLGLSMATRAERGFSGPWRATAPTLSLVTIHPFSPCSFHSLFPSPTWLSSQSTSPPPPSCSPSPFPFPLSFPCFLDSPPHFDYLYSPSSQVWYSLCIQLLILSKGSLSVIFFTSNILSFFLYLNIKQFISWSTTPVEKCIAVLLSYSHEVSPSR